MRLVAVRIRRRAARRTRGRSRQHLPQERLLTCVPPIGLGGGILDAMLRILIHEWRLDWYRFALSRCFSRRQEGRFVSPLPLALSRPVLRRHLPPSPPLVSLRTQGPFYFTVHTYHCTKNEKLVIILRLRPLIDDHRRCRRLAYASRRRRSDRCGQRLPSDLFHVLDKMLLEMRAQGSDVFSESSFAG